MEASKPESKAPGGAAVSKGKQCVIISGGGVGGIIAAKAMQHVHRKLKPDLIVGTSVGSILGAYLALGKSAANCEKVFTDAAKIIFGKKSFPPPLYSVERTVEYLQKEVFGMAAVGDVKVPLMIAVFNHTIDKTIFRNTDSKGVDSRMPLAEFIKPSFSAPYYFEPTWIPEKHQVLGDGGVGYNNFPVMPAFMVARLSLFF
jgi:patatin-like phospholipase/acyl hydrolase